MKLGEQKMFKKTLLALALTGLAGTAAAATIDNTAVKYSVEGLQFQTEVDLADVVATVKASTDYQTGDKIVFTFPNDTFAVGTSATLTASAGPTLGAGSAVYSGGNKVSFTLDGTTANVTDGVTLTLGGIKLSAANLNAGGKVDVAYEVISAVTNGAYDKASATTVATVAKQLDVKAGTNVLDAKVDVSNERKEFVGGAFTDTLEITAVDDTVGVEQDATVTKAVYTINGDFSFLDTDADDKADYSVTATAGTAAVAKDFQSITVTNTAAASSIVTIEATDGTTVIPTQAYTVNADVTYTATGAPAAQTKSFTFSGGSWVLNGYQDTVSFLPFGSQYAQSVTVTNRGSVEGAITVEITANGEVKSKELTAIAAKSSVTDISKEVAAFAAEIGVNGNAGLKIIVDAPSANITTDAVYYAKADQDRVKTK